MKTAAALAVLLIAVLVGGYYFSGNADTAPLHMHHPVRASS